MGIILYVSGKRTRRRFVRERSFTAVSARCAIVPPLGSNSGTGSHGMMDDLCFKKEKKKKEKKKRSRGLGMIRRTCPIILVCDEEDTTINHDSLGNRSNSQQKEMRVGSCICNRACHQRDTVAKVL